MNAYTQDNVFAVRIESDGEFHLAISENASMALFWKWGDANRFRKELRPHLSPKNKLRVVKVNMRIEEQK